MDARGRDAITVSVLHDGEVMGEREISYVRDVDNELLTLVDNLFNAHILDKFVSYVVTPGPGIDKNSILYRIVLALSAAMERTGGGRLDD